MLHNLETLSQRYPKVSTSHIVLNTHLGFRNNYKFNHIYECFISIKGHFEMYSFRKFFVQTLFICARLNKTEYYLNKSL